MPSEYQIVETDGLRKLVAKRALARLYSRIRLFVYPQLRSNPFYGANIRKLKGEYSEYYRYRIGDYRLFYFVDGNRLCVVVVTLRHRREAYR